MKCPYSKEDSSNCKYKMITRNACYCTMLQYSGNAIVSPSGDRFCEVAPHHYEEIKELFIGKLNDLLKENFGYVPLGKTLNIANELISQGWVNI